MAAVPWIDPGAEDGQRVPYIKTAVLDEVEGMGESCRFWHVKLMLLTEQIGLDYPLSNYRHALQAAH